MWARIASALLGIWLMAAPSVLAYHGVARTNDRIVGPIAASLSAIAAWEVTRSLRYADLVVGFWLLAAPVVLGYPVTPALNSLVVGLVLIGLSFLGGRTRQRFGGGWAALLAPVEPAPRPEGEERATEARRAAGGPAAHLRKPTRRARKRRPRR